MEKKIIDYRKRHRRCKYCKYNVLVIPKNMYTPDYYVCKVKDKIIDIGLSSIYQEYFVHVMN